MRDRFRSDGGIARVTVPLLVTNGVNDLAISVVFGERRRAFALGATQLARSAGGGHDNLDAFGMIETTRPFIAF
jgi:hypothetical protein